MRKEIVLGLIKKYPGITFNEILHETNLSNGVISHYLMKLLDNNEIQKEGEKRGKYFIKNIPKKDRMLIIILRNKTNNNIIKFLMDNSNDQNIFSTKDIAKHIKKSGSTISVSLKTLQKNKMIERVITHKNVKLTNDLGYKIYKRELLARFIVKYNL